MSTAQSTWRKSSYSGDSGGNCVEVAGTPGVVWVRDTTDREGMTLTFSAGSWRTFIGTLK
jgi:Domain of unknown function (DUF397)